MSTSPHIDLNADLGESTAGNPVADDAAMMELVTSANVACGFHAGDPHHIAKTLRQAKEHNITVGAHPGYNDKAAFGRRYIAYNPAELADEVLYQIGALDALARAAGTKVSYVKPHGAMYNAIVHDHDQAKAVIEGIKAFGDLPVMLLPGAVAIDYAEAAGLTVIREAFADRGYLPDGTLVPRSQESAVLHDAQQVADRVLQVARDGSVTAIDGTVLKVNADSICVHGDSPGAVEMTRQIVRDLDAAGVVRKAIV
ncbi:LamB/YcsF family protein [Corynebacterium renale]|uniref:5-oxoprolinase subunit PxpA n=1 Tax=Corynebacterium renale TaxID=1724 RepID=UPI000DA3DE78|nr:5-oxoprolinase subunit PxpA [Corynebacterium renale]SQG64336.1 LamB/YcsF family protein [Corynebacterium renale]STC94969.1 LamB/YcsF family protein [Corynebacterium renale]